MDPSKLVRLMPANFYRSLRELEPEDITYQGLKSEFLLAKTKPPKAKTVVLSSQRSNGDV